MALRTDSTTTTTTRPQVGRVRWGFQRGITVVVAGLMTVSVGSVAAAAPRPTDPATEAKRLAAAREKVRQQRASKASQLNALQANNAQLSSALADLQSDVQGQQDQLLEAQKAVDEATQQAADADRRAAAARDELGRLRGGLARRAVNAYIFLPDSAGASAARPTSANDFAARRTYLDIAAGNDRDAVDRLRTAKEDFDSQRQMASDAKARAKANRAEVSARLAKLQKAQARQLGFQEVVADRIAAATAEANGLKGQDESLSKQLLVQQVALAEQLRKAEEERKRREQALLALRVKVMNENKARAEAQAAAAAASGGDSGSSGGGGGGGGGSVDIVGEGSIVSVGGIRVQRSIAGNLQRMLNAAAADGIHFSGGGYRSSSGQIDVRRNNCGTSYYAIYQMPASSCSPPTARPGSSQHERGLAIDFEAGGSTLSRGSAGYRWLKANAANYGFFNLPSEAWHWSTTGR